ncbi:hypothetical protein [Vallitalea okinawensis]|uniref:hypothetical protein n=1 Tax=Vallitalea okinawensis TaxID=2078660 RepID=UPI000CFDC5CC|nr:hypothetical protein [Vallitalea okinawensis]
MIEKVNKALRIIWNVDEDGNRQSIPVIDEAHTVINNKITLLEIPDEFFGVSIKGGGTGLREIDPTDTEIQIAEIDFRVHYGLGLIFLHPTMEGKELKVNYHSRGMMMYPASRIYTDVNEVDGSITSLQDIVQDVEQANADLSNLGDTVAEGQRLETDLVTKFIDSNQAIIDIDVALNNADTKKSQLETTLINVDNKKIELLDQTIEANNSCQALQGKINESNILKSELDNHTNLKKDELNDYVGDSANPAAGTKKSELNQYTSNKANELNAHTTVKQEEITTSIDNKKTQIVQELDNYSITKKTELDVYTATKETELNTVITTAATKQSELNAVIAEANVGHTVLRGDISEANGKIDEMDDLKLRVSVYEDYSETTTYFPQNKVMYEGNTYLVLNKVTGLTPADDGVNYKLIVQGVPSKEAIDIITDTDHRFVTDYQIAIIESKGHPNGLAELGTDGKLKIEQIPNEVYHEGNFNPADYLPKSGGVVTGITYFDSNLYPNKYFYLGDYDDLNSAGTGIKTYVRDGVWNIHKNNNETNPLEIRLEGNKLYHEGNFNPANYLPLTGGTTNGQITIGSTGGTIGGNNIDNAWLKVGDTLGFDQNEIYFSDAGYIGTIGEKNLYINVNGNLHEFSYDGSVDFTGELNISTSSWDNVAGGGMLTLENNGAVGASVTWKSTESTSPNGWSWYAGAPSASIGDGNFGIWSHDDSNWKFKLNRSGDIEVKGKVTLNKGTIEYDEISKSMKFKFV